MMSCEFEDYLENVDKERELRESFKPVSRVPSGTMVVQPLKYDTARGSKRPTPFVHAQWSEEELDSLWLGVRRHGADYWTAILNDKNLKFHHSKRPNDLALRWELEELQLFHGHEELQAMLKPRCSLYRRQDSVLCGTFKKQKTRHIEGKAMGSAKLPICAAQSSKSFQPLYESGKTQDLLLITEAVKMPKHEYREGNYIKDTESLTQVPESARTLKPEPEFPAKSPFANSPFANSPFEGKARASAKSPICAAQSSKSLPLCGGEKTEGNAIVDAKPLCQVLELA